MERRHFLAAMGSSVAALACNKNPMGSRGKPGDARLTLPTITGALTLEPGVHRVDASGTDIVAYLPASAAAKSAVPMLVFLHGAGRSVEPFVTAFTPLCDAAGVMLLAPYSEISTWDAIHDHFGRDRTGMNRALQWVASRVPLDPARIAMSGFSDGATYALAIGRANGDFFKRIVAFAPGFLIPIIPVGLPPIVIAHGNTDPILSFEYARDTIAPSLQAGGYQVDFRSFNGGHAVSLLTATDQINLLGAPAAP
jgi:phospholipase/carboxylesterase